MTNYAIAGSSGNLLTASFAGVNLTLTPEVQGLDLSQQPPANPQIWTLYTYDKTQLVSLEPNTNAFSYLEADTVDTSAVNGGGDPSAWMHLVITDNGDGTNSIASYDSNNGNLIGYITDESPNVMIRASNGSTTQKWKFTTTSTKGKGI